MRRRVGGGGEEAERALEAAKSETKEQRRLQSKVQVRKTESTEIHDDRRRETRMEPGAGGDGGDAESKADDGEGEGDPESEARLSKPEPQQQQLQQLQHEHATKQRGDRRTVQQSGYVKVAHWGLRQCMPVLSHLAFILTKCLQHQPIPINMHYFRVVTRKDKRTEMTRSTRLETFL